MIFMLNLYKIVMRFFYFFIKLIPTNNNEVLFMSRQGSALSKDFKLLGEKLEKKYKVVYLLKPIKGKEKASLFDKIDYGFYSFKQMYYLSKSKVCILDSYIPVVSILKHKKSLTIIQMWHSIGTLKKCGYEILDKEEGNNYKLAKTLKMHKNYDYVFVASKAYAKNLMTAFNCKKENIKIFTLPRVDLLLNKNYEEKIKNEIIKKYPILKTKENVLYCPTFRKNENVLEKEINQFIENFDYYKYNLIIKLHPLSKIEIKNKNVIVDKLYSTFDMLFVADKVISDYSCVIYEAGIRNIPLYFFDFDIDNYINNRGLTINYDILPGYKCKSSKELIKALNKKYDMNYLKEYINKYVSNTEMCTDKIADFIDSLM